MPTEGSIGISHNTVTHLKKPMEYIESQLHLQCVDKYEHLL